MLYVNDKSRDNWGSLNEDCSRVVFDDGESVPLTTGCLSVTFWPSKYGGKLLSDVDDEKDLRFMLKVAEEKDEKFAAMMFKRRLTELT